jgi:hypothetical protein
MVATSTGVSILALELQRIANKNASDVVNVVTLLQRHLELKNVGAMTPITRT